MQTIHLVATYLIVTPSPRYSTQSPQPVSLFPFTLPSFVVFSFIAQSHFFLKNLFLWNSSADDVFLLSSYEIDPSAQRLFFFNYNEVVVNYN